MYSLCENSGDFGSSPGGAGAPCTKVESLSQRPICCISSPLSPFHDYHYLYHIKAKSPPKNFSKTLKWSKKMFTRNTKVNFSTFISQNIHQRSLWPCIWIHIHCLVKQPLNENFSVICILEENCEVTYKLLWIISDASSLTLYAFQTHNKSIISNSTIAASFISMYY